VSDREVRIAYAGHVAVDDFGCWLWEGKRTRDGYGLDGSQLAHRAHWERVHGPLLPNVVLDHLCRRRNCIAIHHLDPVKQSENERRKAWRNRLRTHCRNGHDLAIYSVITPEGGRVCRQCNRDAIANLR
jgi:hypothetical protein